MKERTEEIKQKVKDFEAGKSKAEKKPKTEDKKEKGK